ncbi:MAG: SIMPL domain-containing protein, partial [bacterium]|nr:SIMPL domain-containing protein [bacterium]
MQQASSSPLGLLGLGLCVGIALVVSASIGRDALLEAKRDQQALEVKGFAERHITSDWAVWKASFATRGATLAEAYAELESHRTALLAFLEAESVPQSELEIHPVSTNPLFAQNARGNYTNEIEGYVLTQSVSVASADIARVSHVSKQASALVKQGIELSAMSPEFFYTRLGELKIEMLAEATRDA